MKRKVFRGTLVVLIVLCTLLGILMAKKISDSSIYALIEERDDQLYTLEDIVDQMLVHEIQEVYLDYKLLMSERFYKESEAAFLESGDTRGIREIFDIDDLKKANPLQAILVYKGTDFHTIKGDNSIEKYTFFGEAYGMHASLCKDEKDHYYLAVRVDSEETELKYYFLIDFSSMYEGFLSEDMTKKNWIVFYNADIGICIQNHDNQPDYKILSKEEIRQRQDGYSIIMKYELNGQKGAETYRYSNYEGKVVDERMIAVPSCETENRIFAIGIARDSELLYKRVKRYDTVQMILIFTITACCFGMLILILRNAYKEKNLAREREYLEKEHVMALELADAQIRNSVSQMQPHFMYNVLASIRELILDDPEYAADMLYDFTWYLRSCIRALGSKELISFRQELENIKVYVRIEQMRMGEGLQVDYQIQDEAFMIPPFGIQPLVENAIKHGIAKKRKKQGKLLIATERIGADHIIRIEDDGVGFDYEKTLAEIKAGKRDSTGVKNSRLRLRMMLHADIDVVSVPGEGTKVTIVVPEDPSWYADKDLKQTKE